MTNTSSYFDMVEGTSKKEQGDMSEIVQELKSLVRTLTPKCVSVKYIEYDIINMEKKTMSWENFSQREKIEVIVTNAEKEIAVWHEYEGRQIEDYDVWRRKVIDRFDRKKMFLHEFFNTRQKEDESIKEFARRIEDIGISLKLSSELRFSVFYNGITKNVYAIKKGLTNREKDELSEKLISMLAEYEEIEIKRKAEIFENIKKKEREIIPAVEAKKIKQSKRDYMFMEWDNKLKRGVGFKRATINEIKEQYQLVKKEPTIIINQRCITPLFDTGSKDNYITLSMVKELELKVIRIKKPKVRYTCLGQPFWINLKCNVKFSYNGVEYMERFGVFPYRKERMILVGRDFIDRVLKNNEETVENHKYKDLKGEELKEAFFKGSSTGIKSNYECSIDISEADRVVQPATIIPHAIEKKVEDEIERWLKIGYIQESKSTWCNKIRPVEKPNGDIRLTTNLILLNKRRL